MTRAAGNRKPAVNVATFRNDPLFPRIERVVAKLLETGKVVTPVDVLIGMELLTRATWRTGGEVASPAWSGGSNAT